MHGLWLQRGRRDRLPYHRFSARAHAGDSDQQLCALQWSVSGPDRGFDYVFRRLRKSGGSRQLRARGAASDNSHFGRRGGHPAGDRNSIQDLAARSAIFLYSGAATLSRPAGRQRDRSFGFGPNAVCPRAGGGCGRARGSFDLAARKRKYRFRKRPAAYRVLFGTGRHAAGTGRCCPGGLYFGASRE